MSRPLLLDLFCGAGGASMGYHQAGFDVVGVDIAPQSHYPFAFHQADAVTWFASLVDYYRPAAIHASPPCQAFTQMSAKWRGKGGKTDSHPDLLTPTLEQLRRLQVPWVAENVVGARRCPAFRPTLTLHGGMFGLGVHRPRLFQSNVLLMAPREPMAPEPVGVYGTEPDGRRLWTRKPNNGNYRTATAPKKSIIRAPRSLDEAQEAMGIDWMDWRELTEAIPPAYTYAIGIQLMAHLRVPR